MERSQWELEFHLHVSHLQALGFDSCAEYVSAEIPVLGVNRKTFYTDRNSQPRFPESLVNGKEPMSSTKTRNTEADANGNRNFILVSYIEQERLPAMCP